MQTQEDKIFIVHCQYKQIKNTKKAALLIKEFNIDLDTIYKEFGEIENKILNDCMTFYIKQFGINFKDSPMVTENEVMRLADYLVDHGPQKYGRGLWWLIEKL